MDTLLKMPLEETEGISTFSIAAEFDDLLKQSDTMEIFAKSLLKRSGQLTGGRVLTVFINESVSSRPVILATMTRSEGEWVFSLDEANALEYYRSGKSRHPYVMQKPKFKSAFCFNLNISRRWQGAFYIEYPGLRFVTPDTHLVLKKIVWAMGYYFRVILMEKRMERVERRLNEKERVNTYLRKAMTDLSKEVYCVNSISNVLGQSHDIEEIMSKLMEITLPLLKAEFSVIYVPDTALCLSFHRSNVRYERKNYNLYKNKALALYFKQQMLQIQEDLKWIKVRPLTRRYLSGLSLEEDMILSQSHSGFGFSLRSGNDMFGLGIVICSDAQSLKRRTRLFKITLNMLGLSLENISLMKDFERQIKLKTQEVLDMEKHQRFLLSSMGQPVASSSRHGISTGSPLTLDRLLASIERSREMSLLGELASGVAHQIRNPINHLVGALHLIQDKNTTQADKAELYRQMVERVETMNRMIKEFVQYTRMPKLNMAPESINHVLENAIQTFKGWIDMSPVELTTSFDPKLGKTKMDLCLMNQVFHNIIKNALEAMHREGSLHITTKRLKIKNGPAPHLEFAELVFRDSGPGLSADEIKHVMMPFYSRKQDGMGLGLAIVDYIIRAHGGGVQIRSRPQNGTHVILYLPVR